MNQQQRGSGMKTEADLLQTIEKYRNFVSEISEGVWRIDLYKPIPVSQPVEKQIEACFEYGFVAECNLAMAKMYGYERTDDLMGK